MRRIYKLVRNLEGRTKLALFKSPKLRTQEDIDTILLFMIRYKYFMNLKIKYGNNLL